MNIDCTLNTFTVPGFTGLDPVFGTQKPGGESISSREAHTNIAMALSLQRPHIVNENSTTTPLESNRVFNITVTGITLQIGAAVFNGCQAYIVNSSDGHATVTVNSNESIVLLGGEIVTLEFVNGMWNRHDAKQTLRSLLEFAFIADDPIVASTENVDITTGGNLTIDGVLLSSGERVLLKDQADPTQNGYWIVQSGSWNRDPNYAVGNTAAFTNKFISPRRGGQRGRLFFLVQERYTIGSTGLDFIESRFSIVPIPGKIPMFDRNGILPGGDDLSDMVDGVGRDLRLVLGIESDDPLVYVPLIMAEIRRCCNNNGEIDNTGIPDFSAFRIGDYIDGISLNGIAAPAGGDPTQAWNDTYKNNRIVISGFNTYKNSGDTETARNHVLFTFRNVIARGRMNSTNVNAGGYPASELRVWLEGASGDGSGLLANRLRTALGGNYLLTIRKPLSNMSASAPRWAWVSCTLFLASEHEVFGCNARGDPVYDDRFHIHFPIYQKSAVFRVKRFNGVRQWHWLGSPRAGAAAHFCLVDGIGITSHHYASITAGGVAPAFCVA